MYKMYFFLISSNKKHKAIRRSRPGSLAGNSPPPPCPPKGNNISGAADAVENISQLANLSSHSGCCQNTEPSFPDIQTTASSLPCWAVCAGKLHGANSQRRESKRRVRARSTKGFPAGAVTLKLPDFVTSIDSSVQVAY